MASVFRPPTQHDLDALAATMRAFDRLECEIVCGLSPREALDHSVEGAAWSSVMEIGGEVVCVFGVTDDDFLGGGDASPWMLCADGIERHARTVLTLTPRFYRQMQQGRERLHNIVHAHNRSAIRFIKWCGFTFGDEVTVKGAPFLPFEWRRA